MTSRTGTVRTAFAALVLAAGLVTMAGPALADVPLAPATADPVYLDNEPIQASPLAVVLGWLTGSGSANPLLPPGTTGSGPGSSNCQLGVVAGCYVPGGPH
ncbi:hypothetical protein [Nocardia sp. NPDC004722]